MGDSTLRRVSVSVAEDEDNAEAAAAETEANADEEEAADDNGADEDAGEDCKCTDADDDDDDDGGGDRADWSARSCGPASFSLKASSRHAPAASLRLALSIRFLSAPRESHGIKIARVDETVLSHFLDAS